MSSQTTDVAVPAVRGTENHWGIVDVAKSETMFQDDASTVESAGALPKLATILDATFEQAALWATSARGLVSSTSELARLSFDARSLCRLQSGAIDWAAKSTAYSSLYSDRLHAYAVAPQKEDGTGGLGLTEKEFQKLRSAVTSWTSDNDYRNVYIALYGAKVDPEVAKVADKISAKAALPAPAAKYLREQVGAQKTKGGSGTTVPGWDPTEVPKTGQKIGLTKQERRNAEQGANRTGNQATNNVAEREFEKVRNVLKKVVKIEDKTEMFLSALYSTDNVYRIVSVLSEKLVGKGDDKPPKFTDRPKVLASLRNIAALATITADKLDSKTAEQVQRSDIEKLWFSEQS